MSRIDAVVNPLPGRLQPGEMKMNEREYLNWLIHHVEATADWRQRVSEEYEDDTRNGEAADALRELAARLPEIPLDHDRLRALLAVENENEESMTGIRVLSETLKQYGFNDGNDGDPESLLNELYRHLCSEPALA